MIKGRYVAQIIIDFAIRDKDCTRPLEEVKEYIAGGRLTDEIRDLLRKEVMDGLMGKLDLIQTYADLYKVDGDADG